MAALTRIPIAACGEATVQRGHAQMAQTLPIRKRVVLSYYTAKRFLAALQLTVQRHESTFGEVEVDVQRRAQGQRR